MLRFSGTIALFIVLANCQDISQGEQGQTDETKDDLRQMQTQINELQAQFEELRIKNIALQTQMQENEQADNLRRLRGYVELDDGWISPFNGYQYKVYDTLQTWDESRRACQSLGGDLIVHGFRDYTTRQTIIRAFGLSDSLWIGLSSQAYAKDFFWVNGNAANLNDGSLWSTGLPSSDLRSSSCCFSYFANTSPLGYGVWEIRCSNRYRPICEKLV